MPERLECEVLQKARYINTLTYLPTYRAEHPDCDTTAFYTSDCAQ